MKRSIYFCLIATLLFVTSSIVYANPFLDHEYDSAVRELSAGDTHTFSFSQNALKVRIQNYDVRVNVAFDTTVADTFSMSISDTDSVILDNVSTGKVTLYRPTIDKAVNSEVQVSAWW